MKQIKNRIVSVMLLTGIALYTQAQEYVSPTQPVETNKSPGVKVKLLSDGKST